MVSVKLVTVSVKLVMVSETNFNIKIKLETCYKVKKNISLNFTITSD